MLTANAAAEPGSGCIQLQVHVVHVATFYPFLNHRAEHVRKAHFLSSGYHRRRTFQRRVC